MAIPDRDVVKTSGVSVSDLLRSNPPTPPMRSRARVEVFKGVGRTVERF